ncbi:hypothetical protein [Flavipsychrobacter stenotrophus]|nr:hypothetical protein [Flavipsychrobacter stenotrophus]
MKNRSIILFAAGIMTLFIWSSCTKAEKNVTEQPTNELLTTVQLKAVNTQDPTDTPSAKWVSIPGGSLDTSNAVLYLKNSAVYDLSVIFLDESKTPASDITADIRARGNYHLVCFGISGALSLGIVPTDHDTNSPSLPIGLRNRVTTNLIGTGNLEVTLHHQPNVKNGDCAPGSIDADVNFRVHVD